MYACISETFSGKMLRKFFENGPQKVIFQDYVFWQLWNNSVIAV